jgi:TfoX/Sxy family transcriptional regulator of competence genes
MAWKKAPEWLVESFGRLLPEDPRVERRKMFGYPCAFAGGHMFIGVHEDRLVLRLPEEERSSFRSEHGATPFEPFPGREMREYSVVPRPLIEDPEALAPWVEKAVDHAASLPPKKPRKPRKKAGGRGGR